MTTQQISGITPPLERDKPGIRYLRDIRVELRVINTITQSPETTSSRLRQYLQPQFPENTDTTTTTFETEGIIIFKELYIEFDIPSNADDKEDAVTVNIYNVSYKTALKYFPTPERRIIMHIWAGYNNNPNIIFTGQLTKANIAVERPNSVFRLQASQLDVLRSTQYLINYPSPESRAPSRPRSVLVREIIEEANEFSNIGLEIDTNVLSRIDRVSGDGLRNVETFVYEGTFAGALTTLLDPIGMNWFVHNGVFRVISKRNFDAFDDAPLIISESSGMIDTPTITEDGINVKMLLTPTFIPGQNVEVHSRILSDIIPETKAFRIAKMSHRGDNWTGNMVTELSLQDVDKIGTSVDVASASTDLPPELILEQ